MRTCGNYFHRNTLHFTKQAIKRARALAVRDVAIFDWQAIFVMDTTAGRARRLVNGVWFKENGGHAAGHTMRMVVLGFLARAISRYPEIC